MKEVEKNLGAHTVGRQDDFLVRRAKCGFNVIFKPGEILVSDFEIGI